MSRTMHSSELHTDNMTYPWRLLSADPPALLETCNKNNQA